MKTFSAPLRVYWDLVPEESGGLSAARALSIAEELASMKVFFVTLGLMDGARDDMAGLISTLGKGGTRVTVSVSDEASFPGWDAVAGLSVLDLRAEDAAGFGRLLDRVVPGAPEKVGLSVSVVPSRKNIPLLLEVFRFAASRGVRVFNLPNPKLLLGAVGAGEFVLGDGERAAIKRSLEEILGPLGSSARLGVHDLFLHQSLELPCLGKHTEYAGCQAGGALAYIDKDGLLYPCASWPEPLGDLRERTFREVWAAEARLDIRKRLALPPEECEGCDVAAVCKGACRGLALALTGRDGRDPGCGRK